MSIIVNAGQQPGVPFRLGASGAERPPAEKKKAVYAENLVSLRKNTVKFIPKTSLGNNLPEQNNSKQFRRSGNTNQGVNEMKDNAGKPTSFCLQFQYDASVPAVLRIFIGATDCSDVHRMR